ncbi:MAG: hypothetical protein RLZZ546_2972 [Bacteroidota bacterium]|jgi:cystathionine gamma-synthase
MSKNNESGLSTKLIHMGVMDDQNGAVMPPIVLSTTFEREEDQLNFRNGYIYSRYDNPNRRTLEAKLAAMENGIDCITFSSGLSAAMAVFHSFERGDHILIPDDIYFGVKNILIKLYSKWGLEHSSVDMTNTEKVKQSVRSNTKLIWMESPSNPLVKVTHIKEIVQIAKSHNCVTVVDNTWATSYFTNPFDYDVDIVHHSTTKYLGGHSDILGGALIFREKTERADFIRDYQKIGGSVPSPFDCWLLNRSLATFTARMPIHAKNAMALATFLETHPNVERVLYPGLSSHPQHDVAKIQMKNGFGGMLSVLIKGGREEALHVCKNLNLLRHATSLGGVESLIEHRKSSEGPESKTPDNLLRVSVGIEDINDIIADFTQALNRL